MNGNAGTATAAGQQHSGQYSGQRLFTLLGNLRQDLTDLIKSELDLLKAESSASISKMGKDSILVAAGGLVALVGAVFLFIGLAVLVAFALQKAGLSTLMSLWISFLVFGLAIAGTGVGVLKSGLSKFKEVKIAPQAAIQTAKEMVKPASRSSAGGIVASSDLKDEASEKTQKKRVVAEKKIEKVHEQLAEVQARMNPKYMWAATCTAAKRRPKMTAGIAGAVVGLVYVMAARKKHRRDGHGKVAYKDYELVLD
jgi:hypothetical protein